MNPYDILGIRPPFDDATIRSTYLALVRRFPPEQHPEQFAAINRAYEMVKDEERRLQHILFPPPMEENSPMESALAYFRSKSSRIPLKGDDLKSYLQKCAMD